MKCPKCHYLGFETGDRCRNCGYEFSLLADATGSTPDAEIALHAAADQPAIDLPLNPSIDRDLHQPPEPTLAPSSAMPAGIALGSGTENTDLDATPEAVLQLERIEPEPPARITPLDGLAATRPASARKWQDRSLPLFTPSPDDEDDTPLVRLPAAPRPPLSVRRTADSARLRAVERPAPLPDTDLGFSDASAEEPAALVTMRGEEPLRPSSPVWRTDPAPLPLIAGAGRRLGAALVDHGILLSIDAVVVYFTLRMVNAAPGDWALLPPVPLAVFLGLIKLGYFGMFTAMGGQTIGKMAARIRVVTENGHTLGATQSVRRTLAGGVTALTLGLGFLPALAGEHRALHDRVARTRVVALGPA